MTHKKNECFNCKFWMREENSYSDAIDAKRCTYVVFAPDATEWGDRWEDVLKKEFVDTKAFVSDASGYKANFYTKSDYSCNQFEEQKP